MSLTAIAAIGLLATLCIAIGYAIMRALERLDD